MYVLVYLYNTHIRMYVRTYISTCVEIVQYIRTYVCILRIRTTDVHIRMYIHAHVHIRTYVQCMYVRMYSMYGRMHGTYNIHTYVRMSHKTTLYQLRSLLTVPTTAIFYCEFLPYQPTDT